MKQPLAYVHPEAKIAPNVVIEPFVTIDKNVVIGEGTRIGSNVTILEGARIGKNCNICSGAVISGIPHDLKFKGEETTAEIGDNTTIRECVTINRGTASKGKTVIGNNCLLMAYCHIAHDCVIGDNIIMSNEIIGLSHIEREMVALIARYNTVTLPSYDELVMESSLSAEQYLTVSELTAIVRLANALDRSHLQKIQAIRATLKERELQLSLTVNRDFTLEQGLCQEKLDFFNEVFSIQPVIKLKRQM